MVLVPVKNTAKTKKRRGGFVASGLYRWLITSPLTGPIANAKHATVIPNLWPGERARGQEIFNELFEYFGEGHNVSIASALPDKASEKWLKWFHSFAWLSDLKALGGDDAGTFARMRINEWIAANQSWNEYSWNSQVSADRIFNWLANWDFIVSVEADVSFKKNAARSLSRDMRHILRILPGVNTGFMRLHAMKGYVVAAHALYGKPKLKINSIRRMELEIANQLLPDGGHVERNPAVLAMVLKDLIEIKAMLSALGEDVPGWLQNAIDRAAPMLRMMRHPDGGLALFNGSGVGDGGFLDQLLLQSGSVATQTMNAPHSGFQRLSSGATHIIMDTGLPGGPGNHHHAGTLSFEMSSNNQRMIINCGDRGTNEEPWRSALAATAAHSTLVVNDTSSSAERSGEGKRRGPLEVKHKRFETDTDGIVVEASHDGYANIFGLNHHRAIFLEAGGAKVRGEDRLVGTGGEQFSIRFHLHPRAHASLLSDKQGVLIKLGKKELWRFQASLGDITLEESIYAGKLGLPKHTEQIVVTAPLSGNGALVKWAFTLETP